MVERVGEENALPVAASLDALEEVCGEGHAAESDLQGLDLRGVAARPERVDVARGRAGTRATAAAAATLRG